MNEFFEEETALLKRYRAGDESALKSLIERYQQKVFAFILYSLNSNFDRVYEVTVSTFVGAIRAIPSMYGRTPFLRKLFRLAITKTKDPKGILSANQDNFPSASPVKQQIYRIIKRALFSIPEDVRHVLLLRDQLNLPYEDISSVLELSEVEAQTKLVQARSQFREKVESMVAHPGLL